LVTLLNPAASNAYPVDYAILLCLAGGWPASAECSYARAAFIRRITPWPVERPLQIWRRPMRIALNINPAGLFSEQVQNAVLVNRPVAPQITNSVFWSGEPRLLMGWMAPAPTGVAMRHNAGVDICL